MQQITPPSLSSAKIADTLYNTLKKRSLSTCSNKTGLCLIILILLITAISVALRAYFREPISDDLLYRYILDANPLGDNDYSVLVAGWGDALKSQYIQYFYSNGRTLIHILVQMFAGPWGQTVYAIFLGLVMSSILMLFNRYTILRVNRYNPFLWLLAAVTYLYLYQNNSRTWYSIAGGMNYLFPILLSLSFLLVFNSIKEQKSVNPFVGILLFLFGIFCGWSQECYSLPISGGLFIYLVHNLYSGRKPEKSTIILTLSLWIGTAILVFAPGNFVRLGTRPGIVLSVFNGIKLLTGTYLFWIMIAGLAFLRIHNKADFKNFILSNRLDVIILVIAVCFGMIANTLPQSFNGISFFSAILLFKLINLAFNNKVQKSILINVCTIVCILLIGVHQYRIIRSCHIVSEINHQFVNDYKASASGILPLPEITLSPDVKPFMSNWFDSSVLGWLLYTLSAHYSHSKKPIILLDSNDYLAYSKGGIWNMQHLYINDQTDSYRGENYLWFNKSVAPIAGDTLILTLEPIKHSTISSLIYAKIRRGVGNQDVKEVVIDSTTILHAPNDLTGISVGSRKIENFEIRKLFK